MENKERLLFLGLFILSLMMSMFSCARCGTLSRELVSMNNKVSESFTAQTNFLNTTIGQIGDILKNHKDQIDKVSGIKSKQGGY